MGSIIAACVLILVIIGQMIINSVLLDQIEKDRRENAKYYAKLRREYDKRIKELHDEFELMEDLTYGGHRWVE